MLVVFHHQPETTKEATSYPHTCYKPFLGLGVVTLHFKTYQGEDYKEKELKETPPQRHSHDVIVFFIVLLFHTEK